MSSAIGTSDEIAAHIRARVNAGLRQIAFFVVPSAVGFLVVGDTIIRALFQGGRFTEADAMFAWGILAAASLGLLASTQARLYSSSFFALQDTRTPLRISIVRVSLAAGLGFALAIYGPRLLNIAPQWGAAMLALASSVAGWLELTLLRRRLNTRIGPTGLETRYTLSLFAAALAAGALGFAVKTYASGLNRYLLVTLVIGSFGLVYLAATRLLGVPEVTVALRRIRGRR
jgi:putative peptidoglycan lipid II flippase